MGRTKELLIEMNSNIPLGTEHDTEAPYNYQERFECRVCGNSLDGDNGVCSNICFKADQM